MSVCLFSSRAETGVTTATSMVAALGRPLSATETRPRKQVNSTLRWAPCHFLQGPHALLETGAQDMENQTS